MLFNIPVFAQGGSDDCSSLAVPRVSQTVNDEVRAPLKEGVHPLARAEFDRGSVDDNLSMEHIILMLQRSSDQELSLITHIDEMHNPRSLRFHQWLSAEQFGACYGIADADIAVISAWLEGYGFRVDTVPAGKMSIIFSGTAAQVREAFHTEIHKLNVNGQQHIANMTPPEVPAALASVIAGIHSLHDFFPQPTMHVVGPILRDAKTGWWQPAPGKASKNRPERGGNGNALITFTDNGTEFLAVGPQDFYTIYNENPLLKAPTPINGAGQTLAVIEPTDINKTDVATFRSQFGLPAYPSAPNSTRGGVDWMFGISGYCSDPGVVSGDAQGEASLDVEWIGATAPAAIIDFAACANTSTTSGVDLAGTYVVNSLAKSVSAISVSYGVCEQQ
jgi:subtilase family serine protease